MHGLGYFPGDSPVHRLDPVAKLVVLLSVLIIAIVVVNPLWLFILLLFICAVFAISRLPAKVILRRMRFILYFALMIFLSYVVFVRKGFVVVTIPMGLFSLDIHQGGLVEGAWVSLRFLIIVFSSLWFVSTTNPGLFSNSLVRHGLPFRYGFLVTLTLRFIPLFYMESSIVQDAQRARGLGIDVRGPRRIMRMVRHTYMPLLVSALSRVESVSLSMDSRGMDLSENRTFLNQKSLTAMDGAVIVMSLSCVVLVILLRVGLLPAHPIPSLL